ncbi:MAG: aminotransferase class I/II-fold pyridoxal phosphate-dependent enzyme [Puniceicoccales bacterium]|jgi:LL-diaminopimelate aminotransferase|nr:aminotransferase class I/II-fold pyridoxal phosphate-dependent enzyme [Puniceicoccales bacterium]
MHWIREKIAHRLGGRQFDQSGAYKFEVIQTLKEQAQRRSPHLPCLDFGIGEPDACAHPSVIESLREACEKYECRGYANNGADFFKAAVAHYMQTTFEVALHASDEVLPILGIKSGLTLLAGTLINPKDLIVFPTPSYPVFSTQTQYLGGQVLTLPLLPENHFLPDFEQIPESSRHSIKCCLLNYPNNPTGAIASHKFFETVIEWAQRYHWIIIHDAAYAALNFNAPLSILSISGAKSCSVELHSMSKGFNMTGWRLGWICGNETLIKACIKFKNNSDAGQYLAIQHAATTALQNADQIVPVNIERYQRRIKKLISILQKIGFQAYVPQGGFFVYTHAPSKIFNTSGRCVANFSNASACTHWLLEHLNIVTIPWDECGPFLRFSVTFEAPSIEQEDHFFLQLTQRLSPYRFDYCENGPKT